MACKYHVLDGELRAAIKFGPRAQLHVTIKHSKTKSVDLMNRRYKLLIRFFDTRTLRCIEDFVYQSYDNVIYIDRATCPHANIGADHCAIERFRRSGYKGHKFAQLKPLLFHQQRSAGPFYRLYQFRFSCPCDPFKQHPAN